jgi:hypothetical protein
MNVAILAVTDWPPGHTHRCLSGSASDGSSESDEENNKAEGSQCGPRPNPHEYANERDERPSDESSEGDGMISHRYLPWGRVCHSQTSLGQKIETVENTVSSPFPA